MEKKIVKEFCFISQVSQPASQEDLYLAKDLQDTLLANRETCVGLAANMIGVQKRDYFLIWAWFLWSCLTQCSCPLKDLMRQRKVVLSLVGVRPTRRYETIRVAYRDSKWQERTITLTGFPAQICQHELDHLEGRII